MTDRDALRPYQREADTGHVSLRPKAAALVAAMPDDYFGLIIEALDEAVLAVPDATTLWLDGTERMDGHDANQQLARRLGHWLDELVLHGALGILDRQRIRFTVGEES